MLSLAGSNARDYAILQVFLQTGVRVSELVALRLDDADLINRVLHVRAGKGMAARSIELERRVTQAIKNYLAARLTAFLTTRTDRFQSAVLESSSPSTSSFPASRRKRAATP